MLPMIINAIVVAAAMAGAFAMSWVLGRPTHNPHKDMPYESGMAPVGGAHVRTSVPYYLVAIFFLMFDVEVAFLYAWGVNMYELGWGGFSKMFTFTGFLAGGLAYIWLKGGLEWHRPTKEVQSIRSSSRNSTN